MFILNQPINGTFGEILKKWLKENTGVFIGFSAFAKNSGVLMLESALKKFNTNGGKSSFFIGIDLDGTSVEALKNIFRLSDELYIVHSENHVTFHPKMYYLANDKKKYFSIGSNNLTKGGLFNNYESCLIVNAETDDKMKELTQLEADMYGLIDYFKEDINGTVLHIQSEKDIDELKEAGYIKKEKDLQISIIKNNRNQKKKGEKVFGTENIMFPSHSPSISYPETESPLTTFVDKDIPIKDSTNEIKNDLFWFEARKLTGGSSNILDLSKNGTIKFGSAAGTIYEYDTSNTLAKGGVRFFGLDPDVPNEKDIIINFDGKNYSHSTIKYTSGNQNWRLLIKGMNPQKEKITEVLGTDMVKQILLFEKTSEKTYILNIIPISELKTLQNNSIFWATNGKSSRGRKYGYIIKELEI